MPVVPDIASAFVAGCLFILTIDLVIDTVKGRMTARAFSWRFPVYVLFFLWNGFFAVI